MTALERAIVEIVGVLETLNIDDMLIGGIANAVWGEPRAAAAPSASPGITGFGKLPLANASYRHCACPCENRGMRHGVRDAIFLVCVPLLLALQQSVRLSAVIDSRQLLEDLRILSADDMQGRQAGTPGGEKARAYAVQRFKASGIEPIGESYEHPFTFTTGRGDAATERTGVNVLGVIRGTQQPERFIVSSAHYDHIGVRNGEVFNGADDNASGTAALFALAKHFSANRPANSLLFAAFDAEEGGSTPSGARAFVMTPPVDASALILNLNMDMIGRDPDDKLFVVGTHQQAFLRPYVDKIASAVEVTLIAGHDNPEEKGVEDWSRSSDHAAFCQAKIPCLYFGVEDFGNHHKSTDDYETMTHDFYVRAVETLVTAVKVFDANLDAIVNRR